MAESRTWGGTIRKIWDTETEKFRDHLLRLDQTNRRLRFGTAVSNPFIEEYAKRVDHSNSLIFGYFNGGQIVAAAELRKLGENWHPEAEAAFSVEEPYQNLGLGTKLLGRVVRSARNRNIERLYMNCLAENAKMQRIAKKYDAILQFDHGEVFGELVPESPSYMSLWQEAVDDSSGFVMAVLDISSRLKPAA